MSNNILDKKILTSRYDYKLDKSLIAKFPTDKRDICKMLTVDKATGRLVDNVFSDIVNLLDSSYMLVLNNSKVMRSRVKASKVTGGKSEILITEIITDSKVKALLKGSFKVDDKVIVNENVFATIVTSEGEGLYTIQFNIKAEEVMSSFGSMPLPPYIDRGVTEFDDDRYQTVYSKSLGSSAAPTAGLHFTEDTLNRLKLKDIEIEEITLNVGLGTFRDIKTEYINDHKMHFESYSIEGSVADKINAHKKNGGKILAVGTTVVRTLESAANNNGFLISGKNSTDIFIKEGYNFKVVDSLLTNFHLPKSTLLSLVSAFLGYDKTINAYAHATKNNYSFFSYGDAMLIL